MDADSQRAILIDALKRVAAGDRDGLRDVYRRTSAKLFGVILRILPDRAEAEDVLQEVYLNVWRKAASFDPDKASPITWLAAMARNRAIDRVRLGGGRTFVSDEAVAQTPDDAALAPEQLVRAEESRALDGCIEQLDPAHAQAVREAFFGGLTYEALARRADVPLGTMKGWIRRSLMRLKACLGEAYA